MLQEFAWITKELILPPGGLVLLGLLGLMLIGRSSGKLLLLITIVTLYALSTPFVASLLVAPLESRYPALTDQQIRQGGAQAILVLGGGRYSDAPEYAGDTVSGLLLERLRYAARLSRQSSLPIIISGGSVESGRSAEAQLARQVLEQEFNVPVLATENNSRTTWDNARMSAALLRKLEIRRVLLVTHAVHMPRAVTVFRQAGVEVIPAPTRFFHKPDFSEKLSDALPSARALWQSRYALHEQLGSLWYRLRSWIGSATASDDSLPQ